MNRDPIQVQRRRELRKRSTSAETILWRALRNRRFASRKFRRQHGIGPFIVDFYSAQLNLIIELDGDSHLGREAYDSNRQSWLESQGHRVMRILNLHVCENLEGVLDQIDRECERLRSLDPQRLPLLQLTNATPEDLR